MVHLWIIATVLTVKVNSYDLVGLQEKSSSVECKGVFGACFPLEHGRRCEKELGEGVVHETSPLGPIG